MTDLIEFLKARLASDENIARASGGVGTWTAREADRTYDGLRQFDLMDDRYPAGRITGSARSNHITRHDPARILREVEAKRAILDKIAGWTHAVVEDCWYTCEAATDAHDGGSSCVDEDGQLGPCTCGLDARREVLLRHLAAPYSDHPDFDPAWDAS